MSNNASNKKRQKKATDKSTGKELESYELSRESTLVTQAGLQTAIFSISTGGLFTVWRTVLEYATWIPDYWVHFAIALVTFFLLLSLLFAVLALFLATNTDKHKVTYEFIKKNNNRRVKRLKISVIFFLIAIGLVFALVFTFIPVFHKGTP